MPDIKKGNGKKIPGRGRVFFIAYLLMQQTTPLEGIAPS